VSKFDPPNDERRFNDPPIPDPVNDPSRFRDPADPTTPAPLSAKEARAAAKADDPSVRYAVWDQSAQNTITAFTNKEDAETDLREKLSQRGEQAQDIVVVSVKVPK
jgi:hypothetical protein